MITHHHQLDLYNLTFKRNHQTLFSKLHHTALPGDVIQIRGHNGSGKSTLLRILAGFIDPHEGSVMWEGLSISKHREIYIENMIYIGHLNGIKPNLTVYENLSLNHIVTGHLATSYDLNSIIKKIGLDAVSDRRAQYLSAGQLRRLCLARLMLAPYKVWLLDEPYTALDDTGQALLNTLLIEHVANNGIAVIATHQVLKLDATIKTIILGDNHAV